MQSVVNLLCSYIHFVVSSLRKKNFECPEVTGTLYYGCLMIFNESEDTIVACQQKSNLSKFGLETSGL